MNALETNAANSVIALLNADSMLGKIPPRIWDSEEDATIPRLTVKCNQGAELIYRMGVFRVAVEIVMKVEATQNIIDRMTEAVRRLMTDDENAHIVMMQLYPKFFCFAIESGNSSSVTVTGKKRSRTITLTLVGFDLDRFS